MRLNFIVVWGVINLCLAQVAYVQEYDPAFISPVDDDIYLAGTFGELRSVHFHAGIDIKTGGRIGKKIRTIEDGYIYRVKVTPGGYGKTVYVKHPNGYISVYAHLHEFIPVIDKEVKHFQYKKQQHHLDLYFKPSRFPVNKGEVIGISGNSGYSLGPHLHFEIRRAADHVPLNALLFNFLVKDDIAPDIKGIGVYPLNDSSYVQGRNKPAYFRTQNNNGDYKLGDDGDTIDVYGEIGFSVETYDYLTGSNNRCGVYSIELNKNNKRHYYHTIDEISFAETRYINSHVDYARKMQTGEKYQKSFLDPNNKLGIYKEVINEGMMHFKDGQTAEMQYVIHDIHQNISRLSFIIRGSKSDSNIVTPDTCTVVKRMDYASANELNEAGISLSIPKGALYRSFDFCFEKLDTVIEEAFSPVYRLHDLSVPLHRMVTIKIEPHNLPVRHQDKALLASIDREGNSFSMGGAYENDVVKARTRSLGDVFVTIDTVAPEITPLFEEELPDFSGKKKMTFCLKEDLSGVASYNGYIDGEWMLFEYSPLHDEIVHYFDDQRMDTTKSDHEVELYVMDEKGNIGAFHCFFTR